MPLYSFRTSTFLDDSLIRECLVDSIYDVYDKRKLVIKIEKMIIKSEDLIWIVFFIMIIFIINILF